MLYREFCNVYYLTEVYSSWNQSWKWWFNFLKCSPERVKNEDGGISHIKVYSWQILSQIYSRKSTSPTHDLEHQLWLWSGSQFYWATSSRTSQLLSELSNVISRKGGSPHSQVSTTVYPDIMCWIPHQEGWEKYLPVHGLPGQPSLTECPGKKFRESEGGWRNIDHIIHRVPDWSIKNGYIPIFPICLMRWKGSLTFYCQKANDTALGNKSMSSGQKLKSKYTWEKERRM